MEREEWLLTAPTQYRPGARPACRPLSTAGAGDPRSMCRARTDSPCGLTSATSDLSRQNLHPWGWLWPLTVEPGAICAVAGASIAANSIASESGARRRTRGCRR